MAQKSDAPRLGKTETLQENGGPERKRQIPVKASWGAFIVAIVEAVCVFAVATAGAGIALGSVAATVAGWAIFLHRDIFRIPALLLAIGGSAFNLFLLWTAYRLRNAPAAAWRKQPISSKERSRIVLVFVLSVLTLIICGAEIYLHRSFHHSIM
ncbi:MAG TPA: hypothetical protein VFQ41_04695 [Candidatus Angelobacter sp.]|nr:hypothetical protein [Candidatus Angelobacter sp.]